jgi:formylglycine-generating enzyme required for sulfatase activity
MLIAAGSTELGGAARAHLAHGGPRRARDGARWARRAARRAARSLAVFFVHGCPPPPGAWDLKAAGDSALLPGTLTGSGAIDHTAGGIQFVTVFAGTFPMGCTEPHGACWADERPTLRVQLTRDLFLARTEVTQEQYRALMRESPWSSPDCPDCPVETVTWHQAAAFANAVSEAMGLEPCCACRGTDVTLQCAPATDPYTCERYRLPTEAEWEGAARCGQDHRYAGGDRLPSVGWAGAHAPDGPRPVGGLHANRCELVDMSGNVSEWIHDGYVDRYPDSGPLTDPSSPDGLPTRVLRGGSWGVDDRYARVSARAEHPPEVRNRRAGFRRARTIP